VKYHTATHLINAALHQVLGDHVAQRGSNITGDRLRFDFSHDEKLTDDQIQQVEEIVNKKVSEALPVQFVVLPKEEAEVTGAIHAFGEKYGEQVKVYYIGSSLESAASKEFCGGPHVSNTQEIGQISIYKQESVGKGVRRLYARSI
jgi:alanyl-tRNA synthetase